MRPRSENPPQEAPNPRATAGLMGIERDRPSNLRPGPALTHRSRRNAVIRRRDLTGLGPVLGGQMRLAHLLMQNTKVDVGIDVLGVGGDGLLEGR